MNDARAMIMIVDDNIANLKIGKNALADTYDVFTMHSAKRMFNLLDLNKPDLILLDVKMPEMNGYDAIKILKNCPETQDIPVIFLTSNSRSENELEALSLGAIDYILKPFVPALLRKRIEIHLMVEEQKHMLEAQALELQNFNGNLQKMVDEKTEKVLELQGEILKIVADLVESRVDITDGHIHSA